MDYKSESDVIRLEFPANYKYLNVLEPCVAAMLDRVESVPERNVLAYNITLAVHETCTNIVEHTYADRVGSIKAILCLDDKPRRLIIDLHDTGRSFSMPDVQPPNLEEVQLANFCQAYAKL